MLSLHEAMLKLIETRPFDEITVDDITAQARVGRSTFYRHFATKEELTESIAKVEIDRLVDLTFPLLRQDGSSASCLALAGYVHEHRRLWKVLVNGGASRVMRETFVKKSSTRGVSTLELPPLDIPVNLAAAFGVAAVFEVLSWWLAQSDPAPVDIVADYLDRLAVRPVVPDR